MKHIMLDLETLDSGSHAAVVAIGAVVFDPYSFNPPPEALKTFYLTIDPESAIRAGGTVSGHTIMWWMEQSDAARQQTFKKGGWELFHALTQFNAWLGEQDKDHKQIAVWGNGATFDNVVIRNAYTSVKLVPHWHFRGDKCYRTVINLLEEGQRPPFERAGVAHNALDDAITQAKYLQKCMYMLGLHRRDVVAAREELQAASEIGLTAESVGLRD